MAAPTIARTLENRFAQDGVVGQCGQCRDGLAQMLSTRRQDSGQIGPFSRVQQINVGLLPSAPGLFEQSVQRDY